MSVIIASGEQINRSPENTSTSKQMYSFPKEIRFKPVKINTSENFYSLPDVKNTRATSLGYGSRSDFTNKSKNMKAPYYNIPSSINAKKPQTPSYSFGISRQYYNKVF